MIRAQSSRITNHRDLLPSLDRSVRIPTIVTNRSDGSRPPVTIDRDQCDSVVRCMC
jgi:hypothetical protein